MQNYEVDQACFSILGFPHPLLVSSGPFGRLPIHNALLTAATHHGCQSREHPGRALFPGF